MKHVRRSILILFVILGLVSCASTTTEKEFQGQSAEQIFNKGQQEFQKQKYTSALRYFEALDSLYPFGPYNQRAQYDSITAYYKTGKSAEALAAAERYIRLYPRASNVDYAYYMKGVINFGRDRNWLQKMFRTDPAQHDLTYMKESFTDFQQMVSLFPDSQYVPDAEKRMRYTRNLIATHELEVAKFYFDRKAYVAAANRASGVVEHFEGAPQVVPALGIMVRSYRELNQTDMANDALRVLALSYPNSATFKKLQRD